jgi:hypothetical protein
MNINRTESNKFEKLTELKTPAPKQESNNIVKPNILKKNETKEKNEKKLDIETPKPKINNKTNKNEINNVKNFIQNINKNIRENENKVYEKSFDRLLNLQILLKKESSLKELCKNFFLIIIILFFSYKNKRRNKKEN